jgi:glutamate 5-kinase
MIDPLRQEIAKTAETVVVKVGTRVLTHADGSLDRGRIAELAGEMAQLSRDRRVALVSSGAVGAGMNGLKMSARPRDLATLQAVAAVGQTRLIEAYDGTLRKAGLHAAQVLLTADDLNDRARYLNVRNTLFSLMRLNAIPIINENDTVAVEELMASFGDNDRLAALVANLLQAPLLIVLSDIDGLYDGDPDQPNSRRIETVAEVDETVLGFARELQTGISKGGMASKLNAAKIVTAAGENMIIASGREPGVLGRIMAGETLGTLFIAQGKVITSYKRWLGFSAQPQGRLFLDNGACRAISSDGRSLLAIGVTRVEGNFVKGDVLSLVSSDGREIARGLCNYPAQELRRIAGRNSDEFFDLLGHCPYQELIHRDNMTVT